LRILRYLKQKKIAPGESKRLSFGPVQIVFGVAGELLSQVIECNWKGKLQSINKLDIYPAFRGAAFEQVAAVLEVEGQEMEVKTRNVQVVSLFCVVAIRNCHCAQKLFNRPDMIR